MKTILVPVDLSPFSTEVVDHAVDFAKTMNAKIYLLNVVSVDIGFIIGDIGFQYLPELEKTTLEEDAKKLNEFQEKVVGQQVPCESYVKQGIPADTILEEAADKQVDYIVIGSKGHGTLYEALVGSVCHDVIKESPVPLFVVPNKQQET